MPFQGQVNLTPAPAVAGDFASATPRAAVLAGPGGLVAGPGGVTVGKFAWIAADGRTVTNYGQYPAVPDGFVHREQQGLITIYLGEASMLVPAGFPVVLHQAGDFWAKNQGPSALVRNGAIYAAYADGSIVTAVPTGASVTATLGSTNTGSLGATFTGAASVASNQLIVTAVTGLISIGDTVSGSGITDSPTILAQTAGTTGGAGTYTLSSVETCTGGTVTCFGSVVKLTAVSTMVAVGDTIAGSGGFPSGATITGQTSGTAGSTGTYTISAPGTAYTASATGVTTFGYVMKVTAVGSGTLAVGYPVVDSTAAARIATNAVIASQVNGTPGATGIYLLSLPQTSAYPVQFSTEITKITNTSLGNIREAQNLTSSDLLEFR